MSTINREAAIRNLTAIIIKQEGKPLIHWEEVRKMLEAMPEEKTQLSGEDATFDTISRQAAIDAMATWDWQELYLPIHFKQLLEELPSAEPERKKGEWIDVDPHGDSGLAFECSECGEINLRETDYCPNCGSYMKGE